MSSRSIGAAWRIAAAVTGLLLLLSSPASSTTIVMMSDEALALGSEAIVAGTVTEIHSARGAGGIHTWVTLAVDEVLKGYLPLATVTLRERGGRVGDEERWLFGNPAYAVGESVIAFLSQDGDGFLRTHQMALGKFSIVPDDEAGEAMAVRPLDEDEVVVLGTARLASRPPDDRRPAAGFKRRLRDIVRSQPVPYFRRPLAAPLAANAAAAQTGPTVAAFKLFNNVRWFEPDGGAPVRYLLGQDGDAKIGAAASHAAVESAMAAWTDVATASIALVPDGLVAGADDGCDGKSTIVFNDPNRVVADPAACGGILAIGGYCATSQTRQVNGVTFRRITEGDITFNNGFGGCGFWTATNVAEIATHEIGHTIGLAHSTDSTSTMYAFAHFDGRGASLRADDAAGATFIYPLEGGGSPGATPTAAPTPGPTPSSPDADGDGIADGADNCPARANSSQADVDADGVGDACDNCVALSNAAQNAAEACGLLQTRRMRVAFARNPQPADDRLTLSASFSAGAGAMSAIAAQPVTLVVSDRDGAVVVSVTVPPDALVPNRRGTRLSFHDPSGTLLDGFTRFRLRSRDGIRHELAAKGRHLALGAANQAELIVTIEAGGESYVSASACEANRQATRVRCQQKH
jgi:hypothetical protein